jgi:hypothetical protein
VALPEQVLVTAHGVDGGQQHEGCNAEGAATPRASEYRKHSQHSTDAAIMANTRIVISMPVDAMKRLQEKLATMTPEQINAEFGVPVLSITYPSTIELEVEDEVNHETRAGKRG